MSSGFFSRMLRGVADALDEITSSPEQKQTPDKVDSQPNIVQTSEVIYVLRLAEEKYYIGKTKNIKQRYSQHQSGQGSAWTSRYSPIEIVEQIPVVSVFDENVKVKEYMMKYGIDNVRGGAYVQIKLPDDLRSALEKEMIHDNNLCFKCKKPGHLTRYCPGVVPNVGGISPTVRESYELHQRGLSVRDIATQRNFKPMTIETHLATCVKAGLIDPLVFGVTPELGKSIRDVISQSGPEPTLTVIKQNSERQGIKCSYFQIRCVQ